MIDSILSHALAALGGSAVAVALAGAVGSARPRRPTRSTRPAGAPAPVGAAPGDAGLSGRRLAHELNNILTAVGGHAELARRTTGNAETAACLDEIVQGIERAALVMHRLLGAPRPARPPVGPEAARCAGTVLVVDDEETVRDAAALALLEHGFAVHRAGGGREALAMIDAAPDTIDLVLVDVMMPGMTGPELARRLSERHPAVAVVYMSGYENRRLAEGRIVGRGDPCIAKPFAPEHLAAAVGAAISRNPPRLAATDPPAGPLR